MVDFGLELGRGRRQHAGASCGPSTPGLSESPRRRAWASRGSLPSIALAVAIGLALPLRAAPDDSQSGTDRLGSGVRFAALLSVPPSDNDARNADEYVALTVELTISAHAGSVDFYGAVPIALGPFLVRDGAPERTVWSEAGCHRDRGLPKISFKRIFGTLRIGERVASIDAVMRTIGMRLPNDEIIVEQSLLAGESSAARQEYVLRAHTRTSGVAAVVRLRKIDCAL